MLTIDKLKDLLTETVTDGPRLQMAEYTIRKNVLLDKSAQIINILRINYWPQLTECFRGLTTNSTTNVILARALSRLESDISFRVLKEYLIELSVLLTSIKNIDYRVDDYINYEELY